MIREPAIKQDGFWGDFINLLLLRRVYRGKSKTLYYETHVTFSPDFDRLDEIQAIASRYGFHMGKLLLMKEEKVESHTDMFFTDRKDTYVDAYGHMTRFIAVAKAAGFQPIRYKIENCVLDSKIEDTIGITTRTLS